MSKTAVVYWSGNRQYGGYGGKSGGRRAGGRSGGLAVYGLRNSGADKMDEFDSVAFGCPSMGSEQLEEDEFEPMS